MIEFWAVLGLAITDHLFLEDLRQKSEDRQVLAALLKEHCFRLSRYELGEVERIMSTPGVVEKMQEIHARIWYLEDPCWFAKTFDPAYVHPYLIFNAEKKGFEIPPGHILDLEKKTVGPSPDAEFDPGTKKFVGHHGGHSSGDF